MGYSPQNLGLSQGFLFPNAGIPDSFPQKVEGLPSVDDSEY